MRAPTSLIAALLVADEKARTTGEAQTVCARLLGREFVFETFGADAYVRLRETGWENDQIAPIVTVFASGEMQTYKPQSLPREVRD